MPFRALLIGLALVACGAPESGEDAGRDAGDAGVEDARAVEDAANDAGPMTGGWRREADLPFPFQELAYAMHGGSLVIAGGLDESAAVRADVLALDPGATTF